MNNSFVNQQSKEERKAPQILYAGNSISSSYLDDFVDYVDRIPYIYVRKTTRKNMKRHINKYNIHNENSKMLEEYFGYNK